MKHRLLALAAAGALCLSLCGFSGTQPLPDTITVQGTGIVEARPDQTKFTAGVNVVKPTAAEAVSAGNEMAARSASGFDGCRGSGGEYHHRWPLALGALYLYQLHQLPGTAMSIG